MAAKLQPRALLTSFYDRSLIVDPIERLRKVADVEEVNLGRCLTEQELADSIPGRHFIIAADEKYNAALLDLAEDLVLIAREGTGYDGIDVDAATDRGILVTNAPVVHACTANLTIGLMIAVVRKIVLCDRDVHEHRWTQRNRWICPDLTGMTLGILGFGLVGRAVARRAAALGMKILVHNRSDVTNAVRQVDAQTAPMDEVLDKADVISVHIRHTNRTANMFNARVFAKMKPGSYFINTSRGGIVDEAALLAALESGHLAGAGLDVLAQEPPAPDNPLLAIDNVVCTAHVGGESTTTIYQGVDMSVDQICECLAGRKPKNLVNPPAWDKARLRKIVQ